MVNKHSRSSSGMRKKSNLKRQLQELQHFLKLKAIDVCCIQETHLSSSHRFFIRGYEVFRQYRENRSKGGLLTLVRNNIPAAEI